MMSSVNLPPKPQPKPKPGMVKVVRALYNYTARYPDELSFEEGDILYVYDRSNPEWWKATCGSKKGLIPSNYGTSIADYYFDTYKGFFEGKLDEVLDPLHEAARRGNLPFLKDCLRERVSHTGLDSMGNTPLYWASHSGHLDCLMCLLNESNPPVNAQNHFGDTPLHAAAAKGHYDIVETLLKAGADPDIHNNNGEAPEKLAMNLSVKNLLQKHKQNYSTVSATVNPEEYEDDSD